MGPKRFQRQNLSLFLVKFKKLGFSAPLSANLQLSVEQGTSLQFSLKLSRQKKYFGKELQLLCIIEN